MQCFEFQDADRVAVCEFNAGSGFSDNPFVASCEASELADYFLLTPLTEALVDMMMAKLHDLVTTIQSRVFYGISSHKSKSSSEFCSDSLVEKMEEDPAASLACRAAFGDSIAWGSDFWKAFFSGVRHVYDSNHNIKALRCTFIEFGIRVLENTLIDEGIQHHLKDEPRFVMDVFCAIIVQRSAPMVPKAGRAYLKCKDCSQSAFQGKRHVARIDSDRYVTACSECHGRWSENHKNKT